MSQDEQRSPSRYDPDQLEELYERALGLEPDARASFLRDACAGDTELEQELQSLLMHGRSAESLFANLAGAVSIPAAGTQVGPYRLVGVLGAGGMGTVYRAHDARLDRLVALKFLPPFMGTDPRAQQQFLVEARAAAALDHPNVCAIHEIGTAPDGRPFIAMACYEGETLRERLDQGAVPPAEAVAIATQIARGLGAAHARGIIHRDVKPGNIMLCADGTVRLLDFGLAKMADASMTAPGATPGTIAYMSPEQARGDSITRHTDLWSLGVVLYEMLAGTRPFRSGNDHAVLRAIQHDRPEPVRRRAVQVSPWLARIVDRLLQKQPEARYPSAEALLADLERSSPVSGAGMMVRWLRNHRREAVAAAALAAVTLFVLSRAARQGGALAPTPEMTGAASPVSVAVLPFTVRGPGLEIWKEGMVDLLSRGLDGVAGIHAIDSRTLLATWHHDIPNEEIADLAKALAVARQTTANRALLGSAVAAGSRIRLSATIRDAGSGEVLGSAEVEGPQDSILALVDRLGMQALEHLTEDDAGASAALDVARVTTSSLTALKAYLEGEVAYRRSDFRGAARAWERAVRADTQFALGYLALNDAYGWTTNEFGEEPLEYLPVLLRAVALEDRLPPRERALARARLGRATGVPTAFTMLRETLQRYPDAAQLWYELGEHYYHNARAMGSPDEAEAAFRHAADLQPTVAPFRVHLLDLAFRWHADSTHIARELAAYARIVPDAVFIRAGRLAFALRFGDAAARADARAAVDTLDPEAAYQLYWFMTHPRFADLRRNLTDAIMGRVGQRSMALTHEIGLTLSMMDGRVTQALGLLEEPGMAAGSRYCGPLYFAGRGLPVPQPLLERRLAAARPDSAVYRSPTRLSCAIGYAARLEAWSTYSALLAHARQRAAQDLAAGDSASARVWQRTAQVGEAHGLQQQGRKEAALRAFESTLDAENGWGALFNVGQLAVETGDLQKAERVFRALWSTRDGAPARHQLARILERTGRPDEAREAYQFVVEAWQQADPELQPLVDDARQSAIRLARIEQ